ncbi:MAG: GNAT family N-acetyltransferase [Chloroflexi bacterium]|nr:GNAT family N-acetyltransferase [Chloroflexota bacterium]
MSITLHVRPGLIVRPLVADDAEALYAVVDANRAYLRQWLTWLDDTHGPDDVRNFIETGTTQWSRDDGYQGGIILDGTPVGTIGMHYVNRKNRSTEFGYWLAETHGKKGIMTDVARVFVDDAFRRWDLNRVEIRTASGNVRSQAVALRLGFKLEGVLREIFNHYGTLLDMHVYGMLRREWNALRL